MCVKYHYTYIILSYPIKLIKWKYIFTFIIAVGYLLKKHISKMTEKS